MWISQAAYLKTVEERMKLTAELEAAKAQLAANKNQLEWMMFRVTQLEGERAKLLWSFIGIKVPTIEVAKDTTGPGETVDNPLNALPSFADMGEDDALRDGYGWDDEGRLTLHGKRI